MKASLLTLCDVMKRSAPPSRVTGAAVLSAFSMAGDTALGPPTILILVTPAPDDPLGAELAILGYRLVSQRCRIRYVPTHLPTYQPTNTGGPRL